MVAPDATALGLIDATALGLIKVPELTANFRWGDDDRKSLVSTASTLLYRTRVNTLGTPQMG